MLRVVSRFLVVTVACLVVAGVGFAAEKEKDKKKEGDKKGRFNIEDFFKKLDADKDGKLSLKEYMASPFVKKGGEDRAKKRFEEMDTNGDKFVSLKEFQAAFEKLAAQKKGDKKGEGKRKKKDGGDK